MADKDKSDDTTNAATGTSSDRPPVTATHTPPPVVATPTTVTATPTYDTLDAPSTSRTRKADISPTSDADVPHKRPTTSGVSASVAEEQTTLTSKREFELMDTSGDPEDKAYKVPESSKRLKSTVIHTEKVKIQSTHIDFDHVWFTIIGDDTKALYVDFPLPDTNDVIEPYLYKNRECILKVLNMNGYLFYVFYDKEGREDLSLPLFVELLSRGLKPSGIPQVNECAMVRVSSTNNANCFLQRKPFYADMVGYMLYTKVKIGESIPQPVTNPITRKYYVYIDDATSRYYRVMVNEDTPSGKAKSKPVKHSKDDKKISVKCIDYGIIIRAERSKIFALEDVYQELSVIPQQGFEALARKVYEDAEEIPRKLTTLYYEQKQKRMATVRNNVTDETPTVDLAIHEKDPYHRYHRNPHSTR